ncbi:tetratricopeptide repeat protein [Pseudomonas oryzihabitans]|uniref:tetratricopeptide repeat protein n=1 Tax=Pseudomonas oryzihabitans TaxID=47885 RepID=UPI002864ADC1|nr:tetratricopeptide repeat protein [Pseudomonas psychrotolerans]MDR6676244.1 tetratricopeptide (TPR) repeat protein [Pseudomonas psychrotolerans]
MYNTLNDAFSRAVFFYDNSGSHQTNWSRSVCAGLAEQNFDEVPYRVPQLLEPSALREVAQRYSIKASDLEFFCYPTAGPMAKVKWLADMLEWAPPVQRLSLAQCLAASCRYRFANQVLAKIPYDSLFPDQRITYHLTRFAIQNRLEITESHQEDFSALKILLQSYQLPSAKVLDVCSQAIVWKLKGNAIGDDLNKWFIETGEAAARQIAKSREPADLVSLSSFYRGFSMLPAARGDVLATRKYMLLAENYAEMVIGGDKRESIPAREARKTVYESKLKEMLYIARDVEKARCVAKELINFDPHWSISYHEAAEVEMEDGEWQRALRLFQQAYDIGFPRHTYSQYMIGACDQQLGNFDKALASFEKTLLLDSTNISAGIAGYNVARQHLPECTSFFKSYIDTWEASGLITQEYRELI